MNEGINSIQMPLKGMCLWEQNLLTVSKHQIKINTILDAFTDTVAVSNYFVVV